MYGSNESKYLLHVCCAPCASASAERLLQRGEQVVLFFSNSNIYPYDEYQKRLGEVHKLARRYAVEVVEDLYDHVGWLEAIAGFEQEPEKGSRCTLCFSYNLARTYEAALRLGIPRFSTTLTVSPHKNSRQIFTAAESFDGFVKDDFKKQNGYARSIELSKAYGLYRQCYCGCEFSTR
jgi:predicted adenine nucleotide alpha hydrolase (AANH) superfamily ATPase